VPFSYLASGSHALRQGEILANVFELVARVPIHQTVDVGQPIAVERVDHPLVTVVSQDCDLEWDYQARQKQVAEDKLLRHVLFCDLFTDVDIRARSNLKSDLFKRVRQNQDERYHHFAAAPTGQTGTDLPDLYADFKVIFSLPCDFVYLLLGGGQATRKCIVPPPYLHDFAHRLYGFLGRVAIPEA